MANVCADCTTRYATGLGNCPQCQSPDRYDEHDGPPAAVTVAEVVTSAGAGQPRSRRKPNAVPDGGEPAAGDGEQGEPAGM